MKHPYVNAIAVGTLLVLTLVGCTDKAVTSATEDPVEIVDSVLTLNSDISGMADEALSIVVDPKQQKIVDLPSGTSFTIPAGCFVDLQGNSINSKVTVKFTEYLSAGSIIGSNINMTFDTAGQRIQFESAGMFNILAFKDNEPVAIAENKSIRVQLKSVDQSGGFNTYYSQENGNDWRFLGRSSATQDASQVQPQTPAQPALTLKSPQAPKPYSASGKYFDLNLNQEHSGRYSKLVSVVWEYAGTNPNLDPANNLKQFNRKWDYVNISPREGSQRGIYDIVLQTVDTTIKTFARPVYRGAVLDAENEAFAREVAEFNEQMAQQKNLLKQELAESSFMRLVEVKQLGLYNYDRQYKLDDAVPIFASFNFGVDSLKNYPISVYLVTGNGLAVVKYPPYDWKKFMYSPTDNNKLIAILPNHEICSFSSNRFTEEVPHTRAANPTNFTFQMKHTGTFANSARDIDKVLQKL